MHMLFDRLTLDGVRKTADGYLAADARVARTGIQVYTGAEVDPDNEHGLRDRAEVRVYRSADEVFSREAINTYAHRPITNDHPSGAVDASNWKQLAVGMTGGDVVRDGEFVRVPLVLMDADAIAAVENGKRQLSMGYTTILKFDSGTTPEGEAYDAVQTQLRMNHLAVCQLARGGDKLKIGDTTKRESFMTTRTIIVDGLPVDVTDKDAAIVTRALERSGKELTDAQKALADATVAHAKEMAAKDAELAKKDAEIADLKAKGEKALPPSDPIFDYAKDSRLPTEFLRFAWVAFRERNTGADKTQADWRAAFRNAVRGNWLRLWWLNTETDTYELTTAGHQIRIAVDARTATEPEAA